MMTRITKVPSDSIAAKAGIDSVIRPVKIPDDVRQEAKQVFENSDLGWFCGGHGMPSLGGEEFFIHGYYLGLQQTDNSLRSRSNAQDSETEGRQSPEDQTRKV